MNKKHIDSHAMGLMYGFIHMSLEIACFYWMFAVAKGNGSWWVWALAYDTLAFAPQIFYGDLTDKKTHIDLTIPGLLLILISLYIPFRIPAFLILTAGNCMVHVAGAQATVRGADGKAGPSGLFVGGGSFGVIAGQLLAKHDISGSRIICTVFLLFAAALGIYLLRSTNHTEEVNGFDICNGKSAGLIVLLSFITVAARGYVGYAIPTSWNKTELQTVILFCSMGIGKAIGGLIADKIGACRTAVGSLLLAIPFLVLGDTNMYISLTGVVFFSMTMSITLAVLLSVMPKAPGFCFGITTLGLLVGTLPVFFVKLPTTWAHIITVITLTIVAALCFYLCCTDRRKENAGNSFG